MRLVAVLLLTMLAAPLARAQTLAGPYVGGYLGGGSGDAHWDIVGTGGKQDHSLSGGLIGVQGGYDWIAGSWLLGVQKHHLAGGVPARRPRQRRAHPAGSDEQGRPCLGHPALRSALQVVAA
jgi:hypothetical protein